MESNSELQGAAPARAAAEGAAGGRARLMALLRDIAVLASERSLTRCPYRTASDVCTFRGACRNRFRPAGSKPVCTGGRLNPRSARADELTAALEGPAGDPAGEE